MRGKIVKLNIRDFFNDFKSSLGEGNVLDFEFNLNYL